MLMYSLVAALAGILFVLIAAWLFRRTGQKGKNAGETGADHAGGMLASLFLLVLAIAVIVPWTNADSARQTTYTEARALTEAYWAAGGLSQADKQQTRAELEGYTGYVAGPEWSAVRRGHLTTAGWQRLDALRSRLERLDLKVKDQADARDGVVSDLKDAYAARRQRAVDAQAGLPGGVLALTILTGLAIVIFPFLTGARPSGLLLVPMVLMTALLGVGVYLVFDIAHPFTGGLGVGPAAFTTALHEFSRIQAATP